MAARRGDLGAAEGVDWSFIGRMLKITLLAPDIAGATLDGPQSEEVKPLSLL